MVQAVGDTVGAHPYKTHSASAKSQWTETIILDKDELYNIIDFIEVEFISAIRNDTEIDNIDYVVSMMSVLQKFRLAYASIKLEEESQKSSKEGSK